MMPYAVISEVLRIHGIESSSWTEDQAKLSREEGYRVLLRNVLTVYTDAFEMSGVNSAKWGKGLKSRGQWSWVHIVSSRGLTLSRQVSRDILLSAEFFDAPPGMGSPSPFHTPEIDFCLPEGLPNYPSDSIVAEKKSFRHAERFLIGQYLEIGSTPISLLKRPSFTLQNLVRAAESLSNCPSDPIAADKNLSFWYVERFLIGQQYLEIVSAPISL
ncbi:hypothetical protein H2248_005264 [Termitomyces sp. 'cryptogamus']|nr:hypothetical protein H2248_005264 [Termitomyces sp. 'cryptogamus']